MDDASPITAKDPVLTAAIQKMDANHGFATLMHEGRELVLMSAETFEDWEDAVDNARIRDSLLVSDPEPRITLDDLRAKYDIPAPAK